MKRYLQPPHIQIGFYWRQRSEIASYRAVLQWLVGNGYRMSPYVTAMLLDDGHLPRFSQLAWHGLPEDRVKIHENWPGAGVDGWTVVEARLIPMSDTNVEINLGYTFVPPECLERGARHAVEIVASGADLNLLENIGEQRMSQKSLKRANQTRKWKERILRRACDELDPDYAGEYWEWCLQPPEWLVRSKSLQDFNGLFVSNRVLSPFDAAGWQRRFPSWSLVASTNGLRFSCEDSESNEAVQGMAELREIVKSRFK